MKYVPMVAALVLLLNADAKAQAVKVKVSALGTVYDGATPCVGAKVKVIVCGRSLSMGGYGPWKFYGTTNSNGIFKIETNVYDDSTMISWDATGYYNPVTDEVNCEWTGTPPVTFNVVGAFNLTKIGTTRPALEP